MKSSLKGGRIYLSKGGSVLVIREAREKDMAEYRCTVHYKSLPVVTYRLKLVVTDTMPKMGLFDEVGKRIGHKIGPLSENSQLILSCKAHYSGGKIIGLEWLVEGDIVPSSRAYVKDGTAEIGLNMEVERRHAHSFLTCRLTVKHFNDDGGAIASITDLSTLILMFYVPQATLLIDDSSSNGLKVRAEGVQGGTNVEMNESEKIKFVCVVRARPPPYNITWLLNGRIMTETRHRRIINNNTLSIPEISRKDSGVYACLASNSEGDGHSNAIMVSVTHPPYCVGSLNKKVVVIRNTTITLSCSVESNPPNVTFTWRVNHQSPRKTPEEEEEEEGGGGIINGGHSRFKYVPKLIDLVPRSNSTFSPFVSRTRQTYMAYGPSLPHSVDSDLPTKSILKLKPVDDSMEIVCFAKNRIGRMKIPCSYNLLAVDTPRSPQLCSILTIDSAALEVGCSEFPQGTEAIKQLLPGPSYVKSPEVRTVSTMEVWAKGVLVANITGSHPRWVAKGLPPDTNLRLRLYNASPYTQSAPVILYAKTKPRVLPTTRVSEILEATENEVGADDNFDDIFHSSVSVASPEQSANEMDELTWVTGIVAGVTGLLFVIGAIVGVIILKTTRCREAYGTDTELEDSIDIDTDGAASEPLWESPATLDKQRRFVDQTQFVENTRESGENCQLLGAEDTRDETSDDLTLHEMGQDLALQELGHELSLHEMVITVAKEEEKGIT